jgi:alpha-L-arabinofuranosidase
MIKKTTLLVSAVLSLLGPTVIQADTVITIDAARRGPAINPRMYGIFLEEINTGVDGGLYAELIRNRGFEDAKAPEGFVFRNGRWDNGRGYVIPYHFQVDKDLPYWSLITEGGARGSMSLELSNSLNSATPRSCRLTVDDASSGRVGIANEGFWGIGVRQGAEYQLSFWARSDGAFKGTLRAGLETGDGAKVSDVAEIPSVDPQWKHYTATLTANKTEPQSRFVLTAGGTGTVWFDMVSLFPKDTFKGRGNGMRMDIAQMIADLKPGFVRFPGGCVVEGATPENAYDWKKSIGPIEQREEIWNVWDYRRTHGMGFYEYLQFIEDIGAQPLYVGFAGQTCIYRRSTNVPMAQMEPIEENFLDALQYANGPADSKWGKMRAEAGHPGSFNVNMLEIGNENTGPQYEQRYAAIYPLIKTNYPQVTALACYPQRRAPTEMVDEHYYNSPRWFENNYHMYDTRDRKSPPVYIAEVAVTSNEGGRDKGNLTSALSEGVFLMGAERNGDVVRMASYAPLLANVHGRTALADSPPPWHGMIYFDSSRVFGTVSYYLWKTFGENRPDYTVETEVDTGLGNAPITGAIGIGTWGTSAEFKDVHVEKNGQAIYDSKFATGTDGWETESGTWSVADGAYRQSRNVNGMSWYGDATWTDYTLTLKARKLRGAEGFLVAFGHQGRDRYWWNVGGWGDSQHGIEFNQNMVGEAVRGQVETNRWYDVKVELAGRRIRCYLDGQLIHDVSAPIPEHFYVSAGRAEANGDIIVKAVNPTSDSITATVKLAGANSLAASAEKTVITSARPADNNSLDAPTRVTPTVSQVAVAGPTFSQEFPADSLTVLRLKTR